PATAQLSGYACWLQSEKEGPHTRNELILQQLQALDPIQNGISVGILVRKNADANEVADYLREQSNFPVHTGSAIKPATDNAAGVCLLKMLRYAAHPGDTHALGYLKMVAESNDTPSLINATAILRQKLHSGSYGHAVSWASDQIRPYLKTEDHRHQQRMDQLIEQAHQFESEDSRDIDSLISYLESCQIGESSDSNAIIVETVHKSKGLEYDVVILVNEDKTVSHDRSIRPHYNAAGEAEWILEPLKKELMQSDVTLDEQQVQIQSQQGFGNLCTLYVGMTRAKRALYMISDFERVSTGSTVHFLREQLGDSADDDRILWQTGDPNWMAEFIRPTPANPTPRGTEALIPQFQPAHPRLQLTLPSQSNAKNTIGPKLFDLGDTSSAFGTEVHAAFETIEWLDASTLPSLQQSHYSEQVIDCIERCLCEAAIGDLFTKPSLPSDVWRERSFSYVEDDQFINGTFDRVHLQKDGSGKITHATIIDFKTDRIHPSNTLEQAITFHRAQLEAYRKALSRIILLNPSQIQACILFTSVPVRCDL
ncbi:MAG: 3'-5' exonuclease, partial [Verrucomicrobiota bacterium]